MTKIPNISIFEHIGQISNGDLVPIDLFLDNIRNGRWQDLVLAIRTGKLDKKDKATKIPYVTISGTFATRGTKGLIEHSGFICIDIDKLEDINKIKARLCGDPYVYACFASISGHGLAALFKINPDRHADAFEGLSEYLYTKYEIIVDQNAKDVPRARYISYDPDLYLNEQAIKFAKYPTKKQSKITKVPQVVFVQSDFDDIIKEISMRSIDITNGYYNWRNIGFALSDKLGEAGRTYFHEVSRFSGLYKPQITDKQYDACMKAKGHGITIATFYWLCKQAGIQTTSEQTKLISQTAYQAKKQRRSKEDTIKLLEDVEGINPYDSIDIVDQVFDNDIKVESEDSIVDDLELWLRQNYTFQRNEITRYIEKNGVFMQQKDFNTVFIAAKKVFDKNVDYNLVFRTINSDFTPTYNPLKVFFEQNRDINPTGVIDKFFSCIETDTGMSEAEFFPQYVQYFGKKWLVGMISAIYGQHSPLYFVLSGPNQNTGKTEFFRRLLPTGLKPYYAESKLDKGKDDEILMTQKLLIMDDEMMGKDKKEQSKFKYITSKQTFSLREPYGTGNVDLNRLASLGGTTNEVQLLSDPTGNRRLIPVNTLSIDHDLYNSIDKTELLMEAWHLFQSGFEWQMNKDDIRILNNNTSNFEDVSAEYDLLSTSYKVPEGDNQHLGTFKTATEIKSYLEIKSGQRISAKILGQELKRLGFERISKKVDHRPMKGYTVIEIGNNPQLFT